MDNQERELAAGNPETEEIAKLEEQLREAVAAEGFFNLASGKIWVEIATKEITRITRDVTSDKYLKDHMGYVNALADLRAYKKILRSLQVASSPSRKAKIREKMGDEENV